MRISDWSSDVCSSDLYITTTLPPLVARRPEGQADENPYAEMDISRNAPCPCGSGRKYKHCHGALRSEEDTSELQSLMRISYAVFCLKKKTKPQVNWMKYTISHTH